MAYITRATAMAIALQSNTRGCCCCALGLGRATAPFPANQEPEEQADLTTCSGKVPTMSTHTYLDDAAVAARRAAFACFSFVKEAVVR